VGWLRVGTTINVIGIDWLGHFAVQVVSAPSATKVTTLENAAASGRSR
jgi:hypothetical protein